MWNSKAQDSRAFRSVQTQSKNKLVPLADAEAKAEQNNQQTSQSATDWCIRDSAGTIDRVLSLARKRSAYSLLLGSFRNPPGVATCARQALSQGLPLTTCAGRNQKIDFPKPPFFCRKRHFFSTDRNLHITQSENSVSDRNLQLAGSENRVGEPFALCHTLPPYAEWLSDWTIGRIRSFFYHKLSINFNNMNVIIEYLSWSSKKASVNMFMRMMQF